MLIFLLLNVLVLGSASFIVYRALKIKDIIDSVIALFVVYYSQIVFIELVLGVIGALYLKNVFVLSFILFVSTYLLTKKDESCFPLLDFSQCFHNLLNNKLHIFIFSAGISFFLIKILVNSLNPPFGWDSLNYHFTFPVEWFKHGNLDTPIVVFDDPSPTYYPLNGSLFYLWLIMPFRSVFIADLGQVPFFIIAVISVYRIAQRIGLSKSNSFYSALLFALIPNFFKQLQIAYVDVMVGALFLVCVDYLLALSKEFSLQKVLIYSLSLGLFVGTKTTALPFSVLLIIPFLLLSFKKCSKVYLVLVFILCLAVLGSFSYLRNFFETGNPLYPLDFSLLNVNIFKGVMGKSTYAAHFMARDYSLGKMLFHEGLGAQALLIILPGVLLLLPVVLIKKREGLNFSLTYLLTLPFLIYLIYRYVIPLANVRYLYAMMGLGIVLGFYLFDILKIKKYLLDSLVLICVFSSIFSLAKRQELAVSLSLTVLLSLFLANFMRIKLLSNRKLILSIAIVLMLSLFFWGEKYYKSDEFSRYYKMVKYSGFWPDATKAWDWLNKQTVGNNIAYTGRAVPFPLYGSDFKNNVYYVSVNSTQPAKLHYFNNSKYEYSKGFESLLKAIEGEANYRGNADYNIWLNNLLTAKTDYLFVYSLQQTKSNIFPIEDSWATVNKDIFNPVFSNSTIHIYRVTK
jgi:hypothetical protein